MNRVKKYKPSKQVLKQVEQVLIRILSAKKDLNQGVGRRAIQLLLDAQELVIFCRPLRAGRRSRLEHLAAQSHSHIGQSRVLSLCRTMGGHYLPASSE